MSNRSRSQLVRHLESASAIRTPAVRQAFLQVPREHFLPDVAKQLGTAAVYRNTAYPTKTDAHGDPISSSSQPQVMAQMLEELHVEPGHRVLEIGAGSGYNAALLSDLVGRTGRVTSVELDPQVARQSRRAMREAGRRATIVVADGRNGCKANAPYDRIIVTASSLDVPRAFLEQLSQGGLLVLPLRLTDAVPFRQIIATFERVGPRLRSVSVIHGGFMRLRDRPDDPSLPWPVSRVSERFGSTETTVASLSGATWGRFTEDERQHLLALMLSPPRARGIGLRVSGWRQWELESFICLACPEVVLVGCTREDLDDLLFLGTALPGVTDAARSGLAHPAGKKSISRIDAYGNARAERLLASVVADWRDRGQPSVARLSVEVGYGRWRPKAWRVKKRDSSVVAFDYR